MEDREVFSESGLICEEVIEESHLSLELYVVDRLGSKILR